MYNSFPGTSKLHSLPWPIYPDSLTAPSRFCPFKDNQSSILIQLYSVTNLLSSWSNFDSWCSLPYWSNPGNQCNFPCSNIAGIFHNCCSCCRMNSRRSHCNWSTGVVRKHISAHQPWHPSRQPSGRIFQIVQIHTSLHPMKWYLALLTCLEDVDSPLQLRQLLLFLLPASSLQKGNQLVNWAG